MKVAIVAAGVGLAVVGLLSIHSYNPRETFISGCVKSGMPKTACELDWTDHLWMASKHDYDKLVVTER